MSPVNDSFMSGSLDHSVRMWDLRVNACQVGLFFCIQFQFMLHILLEIEVVYNSYATFNWNSNCLWYNLIAKYMTLVSDSVWI